MKTNIVIPMAGAGSRFSVAGYEVPKPFIKIDGKMMITHVLESFNFIDCEFVLIMQEKFLSEQKEQIEELKKNHSFAIVTVPRLTMGAAVTALAAHKAINPDYDIIFADADNIFSPQDIQNFLTKMRALNYAGGLATINSDNPCYSYARVDKRGLLVETKEKEVISSHAITGLYYFKNLEEFKDAVIDLIVCNDISKGEFYMSNVYNHLKKNNSQIGIFEIESFDCVGTPEQLRNYTEKINERV